MGKAYTYIMTPLHKIFMLLNIACDIILLYVHQLMKILLYFQFSNIKRSVICSTKPSVLPILNCYMYVHVQYPSARYKAFAFHCCAERVCRLVCLCGQPTCSNAFVHYSVCQTHQVQTCLLTCSDTFVSTSNRIDLHKQAR